MTTARRGRPPVTVTRLMSVIGLAASVALAAVVPATFFAFALSGEERALETETAFTARTIEQFVSARPDMWEYETLRLEEIVNAPSLTGLPEERIVRNGSGKIVARARYATPGPSIRKTVPFHDSGRRVGSVEAVRSIRAIVAETALAALAGLLLGALSYAVYRLVPIRTLDRALGELSREKTVTGTTLQAIGEGVISVDRENRVALMNPVAESLVGCPAAMALGKPLESIYLVRTEEVRHGAAVTVRTILASKDGVERLIEEVRSPILDERGLSGRVVVFRDITARVQIEEELLRGRQLESIGLLAGGIAHDFNNYLTGILGNISLAKLHVGENGKAVDRLKEAEGASMRARELARKLLTFAKGGKPARKVVRPEPIVAEGARFTTRGSGVACDCKAEPGLWNVEVDPGQLSQVVNNLVLNALQAISGKGTIRIRLANAVIADGQLLHVKPGRYVVIRIADSGPGIPPDVLPHIFEPYFTTKPTGTGLGLPTCYNIVKAHSGNIFVDSPAGGGAAFTIYLRATDRAPEEGEEPSGEGVERGRGRILVMDDESVIRELSKEMLSLLGYDVTVCEDGEAAIAAYIEAGNRRTPYDAVVMDLTIPGRMNGKEAAQRILALYPDARLIVSSGYSDDPVLSSPAEYGFRGVVAKPYRVEDLARTVKAVIAGKPEDGKIV
jgi:PAS domain S-box-containing protein